MLFQTRWALSYLRGPLTRAQIERLTRENPGSGDAAPAVAPSPAAAAPATAAVPLEEEEEKPTRPVLPASVDESFATPEGARPSGARVLLSADPGGVSAPALRPGAREGRPLAVGGLPGAARAGPERLALGRGWRDRLGSARAVGRARSRCRLRHPGPGRAPGQELSGLGQAAEEPRVPRASAAVVEVCGARARVRAGRERGRLPGAAAPAAAREPRPRDREASQALRAEAGPPSGARAQVRSAGRGGARAVCRQDARHVHLHGCHGDRRPVRPQARERQQRRDAPPPRRAGPSGPCASAATSAAPRRPSRC